MADESILNSTKKILSVAPDDTSFDLDIITHINSVFNTLHDLGIGPSEGFEISSEAETWASFLGPGTLFNSVKTYIYLRVRLLFDPPNNSFNLNSMQEQIKEHEWRLNVRKDGETVG